MATIKTFSDGSSLEYDHSSFDDWCVYLTRPNATRKPPHDTEYFQALLALGEKYGMQRVCDDYVAVYGLTGKKVDSRTLKAISQLARSYSEEDKLIVAIVLSILCMAMVAEEQKEYTRLGKRIKRLGIHRLLLENCGVYESANFMRGLGWKIIDGLCKERGF
jgi:hypothetical protein